MLEPRIVAASTHGRDFAAHPADGAPLLTGISLHGCFISIPMPRDRQRIPLSLPAFGPHARSPATALSDPDSPGWSTSADGWLKAKIGGYPLFTVFKRYGTYTAHAV
jgi:hypothetical protein